MSLDTLRTLSVSILQTSLSHPIGFAKLQPFAEATFTPKESRLLDLHREFDSLSRQMVEARELAGLSDRRTLSVNVLN